MGMEIEYKKDGSYKIKTWGKTDSNEAQRLAESVTARLSLKKSGGKYKSDSDYASVSQMQHDLDGY